MSYHHNQVQLTGRIAADPELYFTTDGTPKVSLVLIQDPTARREGASSDRFHLVAWAALGRRLHETLRQNDRLFVQGRLRTRKFNHEGVVHVRTEVHLDHFIPLKSARSTRRLQQQRNPETPITPKPPTHE